MNTKALVWVIFGVILILGGLVLSVREGRELESRGPRPAVAVVAPQTIVPAASGGTRASGDTYLFPDGNRNMSPEVASAEKKFDTGFVIDPVRGLKRKEENVEYFK